MNTAQKRLEESNSKEWNNILVRFLCMYDLQTIIN